MATHVKIIKHLALVGRRVFFGGIACVANKQQFLRANNFVCAPRNPCGLPVWETGGGGFRGSKSNSTKARPDTLRMGASTRINMYIQLGRLMLRTIFSVVDG